MTAQEKFRVDVLHYLMHPILTNLICTNKVGNRFHIKWRNGLIELCLSKDFLNSVKENIINNNSNRTHTIRTEYGSI